MMMLFCSACGSSGGGGDEPEPAPVPGPQPPDVKNPAQLEIKIYTPEHPVVTRADLDEVNAESEEQAIHNLDVWVYQASDGALVGHISPTINSDFKSGEFQMTVSEEFAEANPNVNIYVTANVRAGNTGLNIDAAESENSLTGKKIQHSGTQDYFGLTPPLVSAVPSGGLPMSGLLKNQAVTPNRPLLKVTTAVTVVRAVSKVRFVFSRTATQTLKINRITFNSGLIPTEEYLFLDNPYTERSVKVGGIYEDGEHALTPLTGADNIPVCANPSKYAYNGQSGTDYETLINKGITGEGNDGQPEVGQVGRFYLRETDKQVTGWIYYTTGNDTDEKRAKFSMASVGDFSRNHTWIVYGYFSAKENLKIYSIDVADWNESSDSHPVFNW